MMQKRKRPIRTQKQECFFCQSGEKPDYKKVEELRRFTTDRGKIISRSRTGICAKHQRKLARGVKRSRHLALLPFVIKV